MDLKENEFEIITTILIGNVSCKDMKLNSYYEIDKDKKINIKFENIPKEADEILFRSIVIDFIRSKGNDFEFSHIITLLGSLEVTAKTFYDMSISKRNKIEAEKERERLLNGDMSKEREIQKQAVEYSNVQNGYEFEEYIANLYRKLGYKIEEVTKKSGDQRSRCNCI